MAEEGDLAALTARFGALHGACFSAAPRPWSAQEFAALLAAPGCFWSAQAQGFFLGRAVADEAELLTLAVAPQARRAGIGRALVEDFLAMAGARGAQRAFLEVSVENEAARALYAGLGFVLGGLRKGYYRDAQGRAVDAQLLVKEL